MDRALGVSNGGTSEPALRAIRAADGAGSGGHGDCDSLLRAKDSQNPRRLRLARGRKGSDAHRVRKAMERRRGTVSADEVPLVAAPPDARCRLLVLREILRTER